MLTSQDAYIPNDTKLSLEQWETLVCSWKPAIASLFNLIYSIILANTLERCE